MFNKCVCARAHTCVYHVYMCKMDWIFSLFPQNILLKLIYTVSEIGSHCNLLLKIFMVATKN